MIARHYRVPLVALALAATGMGCGDEEADATVQPAAAPSAAPAAAAAAATAVEADAGAEVAATRSFKDVDFVESERNRDPFRSFEASFGVKAPSAPQRLVLMPETGIDQMRLIAIITGTPKPSAMLVDPGGVGHVASRGDFIGRAEVVQTGGRESLPVTLNWRVDRIRPNEVVLAREDPASPTKARLTRVLPLHEDDALTGTLDTSGSRNKDVRQFGAAEGASEG